MGFKNSKQQAAVMMQYNNDPSRTSIKGKIVSKQKKKQTGKRLVKALKENPEAEWNELRKQGQLLPTYDRQGNQKGYLDDFGKLYYDFEEWSEEHYPTMPPQVGKNDIKGLNKVFEEDMYTGGGFNYEVTNYRVKGSPHIVVELTKPIYEKGFKQEKYPWGVNIGRLDSENRTELKNGASWSQGNYIKVKGFKTKVQAKQYIRKYFKNN